MTDDSPPLTELTDEQVESLVHRAKQTAYYTDLVEFLSHQLGEEIPTEHTRAFELADGTQVVSITDSTERDSPPRVGLTVAFEGEDVAQAVAELNHGTDSDRHQKLIYPTDFSADLIADFERNPHGSSDSLTIDEREYETVTVYEIESL